MKKKNLKIHHKRKNSLKTKNVQRISKEGGLSPHHLLAPDEEIQYSFETRCSFFTFILFNFFPFYLNKFLYEQELKIRE